ncbi:MAG: glycoside hydrolase family protein [Terriglobia bacterium]
MDLEATLKWIARWEEGPAGPALTVYTDTMGHPTIGIGFNLDRPDALQKIAALGLDYAKVRAGQQSLTMDQANQLFAGDVNTAVSAARIILPAFDSLPGAAQMVIADMIFNLGPRGFAAFTRTIGAFETQNWGMAAVEMTQSTWYTQTGQRSRGDVQVIKQLAGGVETLTLQGSDFDGPSGVSEPGTPGSS